jgi:membrane protein YdbS with pleckstrin-like domain
VFWAIAGAATVVPAAVGAAWASSALGGGAVAALPWVALAAYAALAVFVMPTLRWRRWRWEVREEEIDIQRGVLILRRTLVPIRRVQHVDTERGVLQQALGLATVTLHTAAGQNAIPQLRAAEAERVRDRIAELTRTRDDV